MYARELVLSRRMLRVHSTSFSLHFEHRILFLFFFETSSHTAHNDLEPPVSTHQALACANTGGLNLLLTPNHFHAYVQALFLLLARNLT